MSWLLPMLGGLGVGTLLTSLLNHLVTRRAALKDRLYQEKREAYFGLLNALHQAAVEHSDRNSKEYALWQTRCQLFGSPDVSHCAQAIIDTNAGPRSARDAAFAGLIEAMRQDLRK